MSIKNINENKQYFTRAVCFVEVKQQSTRTRFTNEFAAEVILSQISRLFTIHNIILVQFMDSDEDKKRKILYESAFNVVQILFIKGAIVMYN